MKLASNTESSQSKYLRWQPWVFWPVVLGLLYYQFSSPYITSPQKFYAQSMLIVQGMSEAEVDVTIKYYSEKSRVAENKIYYFMNPTRQRLWIDLKHTIQVWFDEEGKVVRCETADL